MGWMIFLEKSMKKIIFAVTAIILSTSGVTFAKGMCSSCILKDAAGNLCIKIVPVATKTLMSPSNTPYTQYEYSVTNQCKTGMFRLQARRLAQHAQTIFLGHPIAEAAYRLLARLACLDDTLNERSPSLIKQNRPSTP
jgi:hypothetical protein